ncbi:Curli production assembly/transport component CsgF [Hartmannibacter diazotrophicus]|uniref:Curli production assembly/transport component CsgF n=1 Tax=Hartmannibacter diazotrophicus TaxID=1482074 RepID=A0A2C9DD93_9HYPH|nr:curli assembly protein CsgF [Hartmannibacter diazotrophicus]SON58139.1 Curli production assembly/transport component CsgF [Hartmannibacter diazotrophicus]
MKTSSLCLAGSLLALALVTATTAGASQLTYKPVNPSFGGDPLNGNWLLSQASSQGEGTSDSPGFTIDFPDIGSTTPTPTTTTDVPSTPTDNPAN